MKLASVALRYKIVRVIVVCFACLWLPADLNHSCHMCLENIELHSRSLGRMYGWGGGGGGTPRKDGWECARPTPPKPSPFLCPKFVIFATLFMTWPKLGHPIYDLCSWHSCPQILYCKSLQKHIFFAFWNYFELHLCIFAYIFLRSKTLIVLL